MTGRNRHHRLLHPRTGRGAKGYANGVVAEGRMVFVAGQVGWNADQQFDSPDFVAQVRQALENVVAVMREAGGAPEHITRLTWFITDKAEYLSAIARGGGGLSQRDGQALPGDDYGPGDGACRRRSQSRNRGIGRPDSRCAQPRRYSDFVILSKDIRTGPEMDINATKVLATGLGGPPWPTDGRRQVKTGLCPARQWPARFDGRPPSRPGAP